MEAAVVPVEEPFVAMHGCETPAIRTSSSLSSCWSPHSTPPTVARGTLADATPPEATRPPPIELPPSDTSSRVHDDSASTCARSPPSSAATAALSEEQVAVAPCQLPPPPSPVTDSEWLRGIRKASQSILTGFPAPPPDPPPAKASADGTPDADPRATAPMDAPNVADIRKVFDASRAATTHEDGRPSRVQNIAQLFIEKTADGAPQVRRPGQKVRSLAEAFSVRQSRTAAAFKAPAPRSPHGVDSVGGGTTPVSTFSSADGAPNLLLEEMKAILRGDVSHGRERLEQLCETIGSAHAQQAYAFLARLYDDDANAEFSAAQIARFIKRYVDIGKLAHKLSDAIRIAVPAERCAKWRREARAFAERSGRQLSLRGEHARRARCAFDSRNVNAAAYETLVGSLPGVDADALPTDAPKWLVVLFHSVERVARYPRTFWFDVSLKDVDDACLRCFLHRARHIEAFAGKAAIPQAAWSAWEYHERRLSEVSTPVEQVRAEVRAYAQRIAVELAIAPPPSDGRAGETEEQEHEEEAGAGSEDLTPAPARAKRAPWRLCCFARRRRPAPTLASGRPKKFRRSNTTLMYA